MHVLTEFVSNLESILSLTLPLLIFALAARRLALSRSFNRVTYGLMAVLAALTFLSLAGLAGSLSLPVHLAHVYAYFCAGLWVAMTVLAPTTKHASGYGSY